MKTPTRNLPEYERPPLIEVVCGLQFEPVDAFSSVHFGEFWQRVKSEYPKTEDRPPLAEELPGGEGGEPGTEVISVEAPPLRRVFYVDSTGNFLLQVQPSRFLSNWRKERDTDEYPRFNVAHERFLRGWGIFVDFLRDVGLGMPRANQYELTYINHIPEAEEPYPAGIEQHLPLFSWKAGRSVKFLPAPRSVALRLQFPLPNSKGTIRVKIDHGRRRLDQKPILVIDLTAKGPAQKDWSDMQEWFSVAHEGIVRGFTDLTSPGAHRAWGRKK